MIKLGDIIEGKISMNASGSAYLVSNDLPKDIYIFSKNTNHALHLDSVKVEVIQGQGKVRELEGRVVEIVERFKTEFVGTIEIKERFAFFIPDSNKMSVDMFIPMTKLLGAKDGQKVVARLTEWKDDAKTPNGEIVKVLGYAGDNDTEIHSILEEYGLPYEFEEDVLAEAEAISNVITDKDIAARRDMRTTPTLTIDPVDAKDFDDAISVDFNDGVLEVGIHIADVSHYLRPDTDLDKEAYRRGTSIYLVDRVVPMLPERLSNGLCSLRPNEDKLCFSAIFNLDRDGNILDEWFGRTIINSNHRYTYEEAQGVIETGPRPELYEIDNLVILLNQFAKKLRAERLKTGSMSFDKQDVRFKLDENNKPVEIIIKHSKDSNKLIEEFMLLANRRVAKLMNDQELPMVNRAHDRPAPEKLQALKDFVDSLGYKIQIDTTEQITVSLNKLLTDIQGKPEENMISNLVVRTMQKASYMTKNIGHYGLGFEDYAHFTSPIRRYPDVMVHRLLGRYLDNKVSPKLEKLDAKCTYLSERERKAQKAERDSIKYMQTLYMSERIGRICTGLVTSVTEYGLFVELENEHCEGLVRLSTIQSDIYVADTVNHCVIGFNTGDKIKLGDKVTVVVDSVDLEKKNINFSLLKI